MRRFSLLCVIALAAACSLVDRTTGVKAPGGPLAMLNDPSRVDTGGGRLPDLIVDPKITSQQWLVRDENLPATYCSVEEGGVTPGVRRVIRFTVMTPNIGTADNFIGNPLDHVDPNHDGTFSNGVWSDPTPDNDGLYEFASCHQHFHFKHYALYQLIDPATGFVWKAAKKGFCMLDTDPNPAYFGQPPREGQFRSCGGIGIPGNQGISSGWADTYRFFLGGQYFVLDGGDGQPVVPPGTYVIRITVNPPFAAKKGEACPFKDTNGFCHQLPETNYDDNVGQTTINIPDHPGRAGVGPLAGDKTPTEECEHGCNP